MISEEKIVEENIDNSVASQSSGTYKTYYLHPKARSERLQQVVEVSQKVLRGDVAKFEKDGEESQLLLFQDITKLFHLEEKLRHNEKLAAVGKLAAGIAHEIRNPLASMSASIEMLKSSSSSLKLDHEEKHLMEIALREIDRLNELVSEFLDFVKPEKLEKERLDLALLLSETLSSAKTRSDVKGRIEVLESLSPSVFIYASTSKLKQVIWNLLINAIQAISNKGTIEVGCQNLKDKKIRFWVKDSGVGMSDETKSHLFEPFFTTKPRGTGLGLATAYKIVEAHQGEIIVHSKEGEGTLFEVFLPSSS